MSGLIEVREILRDIAGIEFVYFDERDVVRHRLVQEIVKAYDRHTSGSLNSAQPRKTQVQAKGQHSDPKTARPIPPSSGPWGQSH